LTLDLSNRIPWAPDPATPVLGAQGLVRRRVRRNAAEARSRRRQTRALPAKIEVLSAAKHIDVQVS
jgi:hypothetical protein